jgi:hypothetical protein
VSLSSSIFPICVMYSFNKGEGMKEDSSSRM